MRMFQGHNLTQSELDTQGGNSVVAILTKLLEDPDVEIRTKVRLKCSFCSFLINDLLS